MMAKGRTLQDLVDMVKEEIEALNGKLEELEIIFVEAPNEEILRVIIQGETDEDDWFVIGGDGDKYKVISYEKHLIFVQMIKEQLNLDDDVLNWHW